MQQMTNTVPVRAVAPRPEEAGDDLPLPLHHPAAAHPGLHPQMPD